MTVNNFGTNYNNSISSKSMKFYNTEVNRSNSEIGRKMNKNNSIKMYSTETRKSCKGSATRKSLVRSLHSTKSDENLIKVNNEDGEQLYENEDITYETEQPLYRTEDQVNIEEHQMKEVVSQNANDENENDFNRNGTENVHLNNQIEEIFLKTPVKESVATSQQEVKEDIQPKSLETRKSFLGFMANYSKVQSIVESAVDLHRQYSNYPLENDNDIDLEQGQGREVIVENYDDKAES